MQPPAYLREDYGWSVPMTADEVETRVAARAAAVVYSSKAISGRAAKDLNLPNLAPRTVPFGINLEGLLDKCPQKRPLGQINLLFVGLDWVRKGGDIAVAALKSLREQGSDAHLTVVGHCPQRHQDDPDITAIGYLDKNKAKDAYQLAKLYSDAHLLLLPSRGDCTPMVIAEAMAHGTPVVASDVGGIGTQISNATGVLLPPFTAPQDWAAAIAANTSHPEHYNWMSDAAFDRAYALSWQAWATEMKQLVGHVITNETQASAA